MKKNSIESIELKKIAAKLLVLGSSFAVVGSSIAPTVVLADSFEESTLEQVNDLSLLGEDAKEIYNEVAIQGYLMQAQAETGFSVNQINPESVKAVAEEMGIDTSGDEISLSDKQLVKLLASQGADIKEVPSRERAAGVTKVVKRGNGSWDIYLNASFIRDYYFYAGAAAGLIGILAPGIGWGLAFGVIGFVASVVDRNTKHGYVVAIRNWGLSTIWRQ